MARLALLAPFFVLAACGLQQSGGLPETPDTGIPDGGKPDVAADAGPDSPATCDSAKCPINQYCSDNQCQYLASCGAIHAASNVAESRIYDIHTPSMTPGKTVPVYCDMTDVGGGWTLIASTVPNGTLPFGWGTPRNDPASKSDVYAVDLAIFATGFFKKAMIAVRKTTPSVNLDALPPFITFDYPNVGALGGTTTSTANVRVEVAASPCTTSDVPASLKLIGNTSLTTGYYFTSSTAISLVGITPTGFAASDLTPCSGDHTLHGKQILLFAKE